MENKVLPEQETLTRELTLFHSGNSQSAHTIYGCHYVPERNAHRFLVWAPNAEKISVIGDFNNWDENANVMERLDSGDFIAYVGGLSNGTIYKYALTYNGGGIVHKADPFAFHCETGPKTGSKVWDVSGYDWNDRGFREANAKVDARHSPMSVYEMHIGSWKKKEGEVFPNYRNVADELADYCHEMGFTHVELMPITEYPYEGSWGYQVTGFFAPTSRYGTPQDFKYFVDKLHEKGIAVIVDWVPAHFPKDSHGLAYFDGTAQFERLNPEMAAHPQWGTLIFEYSKPEVRSFLFSSACFFAEEYHIDGLRFDAVSSMLYLGYCREGGFEPNPYGYDIDLGAVSFLKEINERLHNLNCITVAEESSAYAGVTAPTEHGGLGFTFKWDMGYMHDTLDYFELDPVYRCFEHNKLTFSMMYAYNEHFVLAYSHDEVVHGKRSMLDKMSGDYEQKFFSLRSLYGYQFAHPGKKHIFMGSEFGQFIEWNPKIELDWFLLKYPSHDSMLAYFKELNKFYINHPALYAVDDSWEGFEWLNVEDNERSCLAFMRKAPNEKPIVCVCNFTPVFREDYMIGLNCGGKLDLKVNSDEARFGGYGCLIDGHINVHKDGFYGYSHSAQIKVPPMSCLYFELTVES